MTEQVRIGFVGLGDQGAPMAERILAAGGSLSVYSRRSEVSQRFEELGARVTGGLRELGQVSDVVEICVVDDEQVREVVLGENLLSGMRPGGVIAIHSTVHPRTCQQLGEEAARVGVKVIDAPVSGGGAVGARAGTLTVIVGGEREVFERCKPIFSAFGEVISYVGPLGSGQRLKLLNNYMLAIGMFGAFETGRLIHSLGIDPHGAAAVLPTSSSSSWALRLYAQSAFSDMALTKHERGSDHALRVWQKDLRLFREIAEEEGIDIAKSRQSRGLGHRDAFAGVCRELTLASGRSPCDATIRVTPTRVR